MGMIFKNLEITGSLIGTRPHICDMLELAKKTNLQAWGPDQAYERGQPGYC
jgi:D-arabinose 1-dehydrogenase-like Zn-dependent alcohol dehydrogenase